MKKILSIFILSVLLISLTKNSSAVSSYNRGKGPLKITEETANFLEYYFSGGKMGVYAKKQKVAWKPGVAAISEDGAFYAYMVHPLHIGQADSKNYAGMVIADCKKYAAEYNKTQNCFLFANGYRIVWDNGSDKKKRRLKKKDIKAGKTIAILSELGFYDGGHSASDTSKNNEQKYNKNSSQSNGDIVKQIKELKKLFDDGILTKEEFEKAKEKLLN